MNAYAKAFNCSVVAACLISFTVDLCLGKPEDLALYAGLAAFSGALLYMEAMR